MAWGRRSLFRAVLLGFVAQVALANADAAADADVKSKVDPPAAGSTEGLVYEAIDKQQVMTGNITTAKPGKKPAIDGWWNSKICTVSGEYCVFTNRRLQKGRGLAMVSRFEDFQKAERIEEYLNKGENKVEEEGLFTETEVVDKGIGITATKNIRRGKKLMSWSPVLFIHTDFFQDVKKKSERRRILEAAVAFLPDETRAKVDRQRIQGLKPGENQKTRSIEDIILGSPFEVNFGYEYGQEKHSRHYAHYPEMAVVQHNCRPNMAYHIDPNFAIRVTVARRTQGGEELTLAYIDPFWPQYKRQAWVQKRRGLGKPCNCQKCNPKGGDAEIKESEERVKRIEEILAKLKNHDSTDITEEMIDEFLALVDKESMHAKLADFYENAAMNYNYLGYDVKAKKYADLAVQAGIIEEGPDSNSVIANRIFASDIKGHFSYRFTLKRKRNKADKGKQ
ncbi:hypothetical protein QBC34DRAFT_459166 [Podospora aff. communis PSN243]|uniref:SET domain-containing protein n=1 Tax=Podospora aff. communis PSN243 TaxID=3040156 RepID=A0AAV9GTH3_9PEZI|nr:hypothetical protein QBC34DRAFT_459166 [Podospora aff. communis PSN243]